MANRISDDKITGFDSNLAGKIATISDYYLEINTGENANLATTDEQFPYYYHYDDEPNYPLARTIGVPNLNQMNVLPATRTSWAKGMIMGEATGDLGTYGDIFIKLFNPTFDDRGNPVWIVKCKPNLVDLHDPSETLVGKVWKHTEIRGDGAATEYFYEDGSFEGTTDENNTYWVTAPGPSLGEYLDPAYLTFAPKLQEYELKYGNATYNYAAIHPGIYPAIRNLSISEVFSTRFKWYAEFCLGNTPHHWFELGGIVRKGVCYSTSPNPTVDDNISLPTNKLKSYSQPSLTQVEGLTANTTYYARAFQEREVLAGGTEVIYGEQTVVMTSAVVQPPSILAVGPGALTNNSFSMSMFLNDAGEAGWSGCGFVYSSSNPTPTIGGVNCLVKVGNPYTTKLWLRMDEYLTGLLPNTKYYVRAYITTTTGTTYVSEWLGKNTNYLPGTSPDSQGIWSVTTKQVAGLPTLYLPELELLQNTVMQIRVTMSGDGGSPITEAGIVYSTSANPTVANTKVISTNVGFTDIAVEITGLLPDTTYYVRGYAINAVGTSYGWERSYTTTRDVKFTTIAATNITKQSATLSVVVDDLKPADIKKQGFVLSPTNSTTASLVIGVANTVLELEKITNGTLTLSATGLQAGTTYYYRPFINKSEVTSSAVYGDIKAFSTINNVLKPTIEINNWKSDSDNKKLKVNLRVISDGGDPLAKFYLDIVDEGETLSTTLGSNAIECTKVGSDYYVEFDMTGKAAGTYGVRGYGVNTAGTATSSFLNVEYVVVGQSMPLIGVSKHLSTSDVSLNAYIFNTGNSVILDKVLKLKNLTDATEETLTLEASQAGLNHIFNHYSKSTPLAAKVFRLELSVRTEYTRDFNEDVNAISFVEFTTPAVWGSGVADKDITVDLTQDIVAESKSSTPQMRVKITGDVAIGSIVKVVARKSEYGIPTVNGDKPGDISATKPVASIADKELVFNLVLPSSGKYITRAFYVENGIEYSNTAALRTLTVLAVDLVADVSTDDVDADGNVNPNVFAPPIVGNYNGRPYTFKNKKWLYDSTDKSWQRDYGYSVEDKIADLYDYIDSKLASATIVSQDADEPVLSTGTVLAPSAAKSVKSQSVIDIEDELGAITGRVTEIEDAYLETKSLADVIELVAMQSTAPEFTYPAPGYFTTGDHYYNTTSKRVSVATPMAGVGLMWILIKDYRSAIYNYNGLSYVFDGEDLVPIKMYAATAYKVYVAKISQTGTAAPTVTVLENTIGDIVWTRIGVGEYAATLSDAFTTNTVLMQQRIVFFSTNAHSVFLDMSVLSNSVLRLSSFLSGGVNADDELDVTIIEIRVY